MSATMFDVSMAEMRTFNSVMVRELAQLGYFLGPTLGGLILIYWGYPALYWTCALLSVLVMDFMPLLFRDPARGSA